MFDRFNPAPLIRAAFGSVRSRTRLGVENSPDWAALSILVGLPTLAVLAAAALDWKLPDPGLMLAGIALLSASLVALIPQFSAWRERLYLSSSNPGTAKSAMERIDEAVYQLLTAVFVAIGLSVLILVASFVSEPGDMPRWFSWGWSLVRRCFNGLVFGGAIYLLLAFILIGNLLFDAYRFANGIEDNPVQEDIKFEEDDEELR